MKKTLSFILACAMSAMALTGCASQSTTVVTTAAAETTTEAPTAAPTAESVTGETTIAPNTAAQAESEGKVLVKAGSLKGPTSMGLVSLMDQAKKGEALNTYDFTMVTAADELLAKVVSGDLDIALVPANVASVLYNKTKGNVTVIDINTLGVLYVVSGDDSIKTIADLKGKTVYMTGKGTTPDYVINYLLAENGLTKDDVTLEYKSEATEVAAVLKENSDAIGLLPQPFATVAMAQNENLKLVLDLTKEWETLQGDSGSQLVTGVTIVRNDFLADNKEAVDNFLKEHKDSADYAASNPDETAELVAAQGIIEKAPVAKKALPYCNITCITGEDMKAALSGYLQVLFDQEPSSVGGTLPADDFYYLP